MPQLPLEAGSTDQDFMQLALQLASEAAAVGEVPVGAVVVKDGEVVGVGRNSPIQSCDASAHAEMLALRAAANALGNYRLDDCTLYVTLEPCAMCSGGILHSRIRRVVFAAADPKTGCAGSVLNLFAQPLLNHQTQVEGGLLAEQASQILQEFFKQRRENQRELAVPLREDALRTPDRCFEGLPDYHWESHFVNDLPSLAGLRMHYVDEGPRNAANIYLCLHPISGWSFNFRHLITDWVGKGIHVLVPDLIGFGKSDKPKREYTHSVQFHCQYLLEWLERQELKGITLVVPHADHPLAQPLMSLASDRMNGVRVEPLAEAPTEEFEELAQQAPYPDQGHRAAQRAFSSGLVLGRK
jgi:tRNA(adenine34) deaminase